MWKTTPVSRELVEVQPPACDDVETSRVVSARQPVVLEVVGRHEVLRRPRRRRQVEPRVAVVRAADEVLQGEEGVGGPALAEVELDRVRRPVVRRRRGPRRSRRRSAPARHASASRSPTASRARRSGASTRGRRGTRSPGTLPARAAEQLVVGRQQLDGAAGSTRICTLGLVSPSPVIRSSTTPPSRLRTTRGIVHAESDRLGLHRREPGAHRGRLARGRRVPAAPRGRRAALPDSGHALVDLHDHLRIDGWAPHSVTGSRGRRDRGGPRPPRVRHAHLRRTAGGTRTCCPVGQARVRAVHRDAEADRDVALELGGRVGDQVATDAVGDQLAIRRAPGAGQHLLAQRPRRGVADRHQREPARAWLGITPGSRRGSTR